MNHGPSIYDAIRKVNRRIAEIRKDRGLTQAELAEKMDMGLRDLQELEAHSGMTLTTFFRFVEALDCHPKEFFKEPKTKRNGRGRPKRRNKSRMEGLEQPK